MLTLLCQKTLICWHMGARKYVRILAITYFPVEHNSELSCTLDVGVAPKDYRGKFVEATMIFQHQTVIDPTTRKSVPLCEWKCEEDQEKHQLKCGKYPLKQMIIESTVCRIT